MPIIGDLIVIRLDDAGSEETVGSEGAECVTAVVGVTGAYEGAGAACDEDNDAVGAEP